MSSPLSEVDTGHVIQVIHLSWRRWQYQKWKRKILLAIVKLVKMNQVCIGTVIWIPWEVIVSSTLQIYVNDSCQPVWNLHSRIPYWLLPIIQNMKHLRGLINSIFFRERLLIFNSTVTAPVNYNVVMKWMKSNILSIFTKVWLDNFK